ncbi:tryptophan--tRNA ligase [Ahniella affigens]|uniref:Tryptophan--tRNA ligase n=1 Tax=Ahniella affigens TaxID=2021234 RepID=A0A2P1PS41_9GAMM|nr:tryptophan--tRNA ligase [Ahniella affigens]AVP97654.1 tryptophan--tRNA ligase [Ahniella affigens]
MRERHLTGITTTGSPHLGNYVGAIRPAIAASQRADVESFYFLADFHALVKCQEPERIQRSTLEIAATWLALGLDHEQVFFYRQSDIPEIPQLTWYLSCVAGKGLLNRAHAYKASVDANLAQSLDEDAGISMGLFNYPVLMAADILIFNAHQVPVGRDQIQHIEIARDLAARFNHVYGDAFFTLPSAAVDEQTAILPGLDGRKMSKSYDNTIPLWLPEPELRKAILGIVTNSLAPGEPKNPDDSHIFTIYQAFASAEETATMRQAFLDGIAWGEAKQKLFERINQDLAPARERYRQLTETAQGRDELEAILQAGGQRARARATPFLARLNQAVGLRSVARLPVGSASESSKLLPALAEFKTYRESDGLFYFKLVSAEGQTMLLSRGFTAPKDSGQWMAKALESGDQFAVHPHAGGFAWQDEAGAVLAVGTVAADAVQAAIRALRADRDAKKAEKAKAGSSA